MTVTSEDLHTVDYVLFRLVVPFLIQLEGPLPDAVAFVTLVPHLNVPVGSPMKLFQVHLAQYDGSFQVIAAHTVVIPRPEILS